MKAILMCAAIAAGCVCMPSPAEAGGGFLARAARNVRARQDLRFERIQAERAALRSPIVVRSRVYVPHYYVPPARVYVPPAAIVVPQRPGCSAFFFYSY